LRSVRRLNSRESTIYRLRFAPAALNGRP
jgi:hypothetical protein